MPAPTKKSGKGRGGGGGGDKRERKPAMKRGGQSAVKRTGGGGGGGGGARGRGGAPGGGGRAGGLAKGTKGKNAAHRQQSFYEVDDEDEDFAGRGAAMDEEYGDAKGKFEDLPSDFEDEEIDEDEVR